jgi:hypothetical protein
MIFITLELLLERQQPLISIHVLTMKILVFVVGKTVVVMIGYQSWWGVGGEESHIVLGRGTTIYPSR